LLTFYTLDYIIDNDIIIAYKMNEIALPPERGFPFQLVAEHRLQPGLGFLSPVVFEQRYYAGLLAT